MFDESKHPRDEAGKFTDGTKETGKEYRQNTDYTKILNEDDISELENPLYEGYLSELSSRNYQKHKAKEEIETTRKILRDLSAYSDEGLIEFAEKTIEGKIKPTAKYTVGKISDRQRKDIERLTGEPLNAEFNTITGMQIQHIARRHGTQGKADSSMAELSDYGLMNYILNEYDTAELVTSKGNVIPTFAYIDKNGNPAKQIKFSKRLGANYVIVEAISDITRFNDIKIVTMYIKK